MVSGSIPTICIEAPMWILIPDNLKYNGGDTMAKGLGCYEKPEYPQYEKKQQKQNQKTNIYIYI